ncbi:MAG: glycosyltransferase family 2 protein [bacterium]|nr:glycosyltransferase family 2 protein [bacterium]
MKLPKIFIIVLNYNGKDTIKSCLDSVFCSNYPNFEVVVVDNNSTDGSLELVKNLFSKFHFIKNEKNLGFAAGNNVGIRFALEKLTDYVFLLNNDAVLEKDTLSKLIEQSRKETAAITSPVIYNKEGKIWFAGGKIKWFSMKAVHSSERPKEKSAYQTEYISGCAMLIKKEVFKKIGLLDEDFFLYYEDADFCVRAGKNGFKCAVILTAKITHFEKSESDLSNKIYWLVISGLIFFDKNTPRAIRFWTSPYLYLRKIKNLIDTLDNKNKYADFVKKAYSDFNLWKKKNNYPL